jgi:aminoglycoside phosphotransferase family enzyme/predicted kinase
VSQAIEEQQIEMLALLRSRTSYADRPSAVQIIETHISWLFLTDRYAYKLKKPVKFNFVDFSTPVLRHQACLDELRLNRRLAPGVYLAVIPITEESNGELQLGGSGQEIDWVVQMKRLLACKALDQVLKKSRLKPTDAQTISRFLANFYSTLPAESLGPDEYYHTLDRHIRANRDALLESLFDDQVRVRRIHSAQLRYLNIQRPRLDSRVLAGRIVEGHGDLRPEHIYLEDPPVVIDCIEFSSELRTVDIADELNFVAMECDRLGNGDLGTLIVSMYEDMNGDRIPGHLCSFYRSYRACVRAKVAFLRAAQQTGDQQQTSRRLTRQYIDWADHYAEQLGRPCLIVVFGLMGSGKSTLAKKLADALDIDVLSTDHIRRSMLGPSSSPTKYGKGLYRADSRRQVYDELFRQAGTILDKGLSLIVDGTFLSRALRSRAADLSRRHGAEVVNILCECPKEVSLARIQKRAEDGGTESEARVDLFEAQVRDFEPPIDYVPTVRIDTTDELVHQLQKLCDKLRTSIDRD